MTGDEAASALERLHVALEAVRTDLTATSPEWAGLHIRVVDEQQWDDVTVVAYVADAAGLYWSGAGALQAASPWIALASVAEGAQDTLAEVHRVVWPLCPTHRHGVHVRPAGQGADWTPDDFEVWSRVPPVWWCRGGGGHDLALVGRLR